jgi:hypothetical protein
MTQNTLTIDKQLVTCKFISLKKIICIKKAPAFEKYRGNLFKTERKG